MENAKKLLGTYVAFLRSLYLLHQNHHWQTNGLDFYGNHLLFQRIYESAQENADDAAEKAVGLCGCDCIDLAPQILLINTILKKYAINTKNCEPIKFIQASLQAEEDFLKFSEKIYNSLKEKNQITLGLDDMLMSIANKREGSVYLLKQILLNKELKEKL